MTMKPSDENLKTLNPTFAEAIRTFMKCGFTVIDCYGPQIEKYDMEKFIETAAEQLWEESFDSHSYSYGGYSEYRKEEDIEQIKESLRHSPRIEHNSDYYLHSPGFALEFPEDSMYVTFLFNNLSPIIGVYVMHDFDQDDIDEDTGRIILNGYYNRNVNKTKPIFEIEIRDGLCNGLLDENAVSTILGKFYNDILVVSRIVFNCSEQYNSLLSSFDHLNKSDK